MLDDLANIRPQMGGEGGRGGREFPFGLLVSISEMISIKRFHLCMILAFISLIMSLLVMILSTLLTWKTRNKQTVTLRAYFIVSDRNLSKTALCTFTTGCAGKRC